MLNPSHKATPAAVLVFLAAALSPALAQNVLISDFTGTDPALNAPWTPTTFLAPGIGYSGWDFGPGASPITELNDAFGFQVVAEGDLSTLAEAIAGDEYIGFTLTPPTGGDLDLGGLEVEFSIERLTFHASQSYALMTSATGFAEGSQLFTTNSLGNEGFERTSFRFFIPSDQLNDIADPLEFRLYAFETRFAGHQTSLTSFSITDFAGETFTLTLNPGLNGTATATPDSVLYREGEVVRLDATPNSGFRFGGWSGDLVGLGNPAFITMDANKTITPTLQELPAPRMEVGMNIASVEDFGSDWPFVDQMRRTRDWVTRRADGTGGFDTELADEIPLDANGFPTQSPFTPAGEAPQIPHTILVDGFPYNGVYTFTCEGTGTLRLNFPGGGDTIQATGGITTLAINIPDRDTAIVGMEIRETGPGDPLRNFELIPPGMASTPETFHPLFMRRLRPFQGLRFMDWGRTNGSPLENFADRTTPDTFTQARAEGVALEHIADLANRLQRDPWICIPHLATDDYVRQCARLLRDRVNPDLEIYVEYSNETWNPSGPFTQTQFVQQEGVALNLDPDPFIAAQRFVAKRSVEIWAIFEEEFGGGERLVNVLATQSANSSLTQFRVDGINDPAINPRLAYPEALAIAPYFGPVFTPDDITNNGYPTVDELVTTIAANDIEFVRNHVRAQKAIADKQGYELICYEGGQHFVGIFGAENDDTLTDLLTSANRDPRIGDRYAEYLQMLLEEGVESFWHFSYVGRHGKFGSWGTLEVQDEDFSTAHKHRALLAFIETQNPAPADGDSDGRPDSCETVIDAELANAASGATHALLSDSDADGLLDGDEAVPACAGQAIPLAPTNPRNPDSDGDGFDDGIEVLFLLTDPLDPNSPDKSAPEFADVDGDGLPAIIDPNDNNVDSDGDRYSDDYELRQGTDPLLASSKPGLGDANGNGAITAVDVTVLKQVLQGFNPPSAIIDNVDTTLNGRLGATDVTRLKQYLIDPSRKIP
jgi:hypothetical protein